MAGYFSNHSQSQSRFLANSAAAAGGAAAATAASPGAGAPPARSGPSPTPRSRQPSSKHFSTTVLGDEKAPPKERAPSASPLPTVHPLRNTWVFWFRQQRAPGNKIISYEEGIKKIAAFGSVESFWSLWTHLHAPSALQPTTDYLLFHAGVRRPVWEDPLNITGGKWIIRLRKGVADRIWEDLILAVIGDQFDECGPASDGPIDANRGTAHRNGHGNGNGNGVSEEGREEWPEICGCTISVRQNEDILSIWNRSEVEPQGRERIRDTIRKVLNLPLATVMEYKTNNDSMQDKSSFRNSAIDRTPLA